MPQNASPRSAMEIDLTKLSSPRIFLVRMLVFLVLCALVMVVLYKPIKDAFFANPGLNALIGGVLLIGIILAFRQVIRLYPEVAWVNSFRISDPGLAVDRHPTLLAPMAAILGGERTGRMTITQQTMRHLLDSIATRLDEARDISRYMTGLLVFLGLLGTFWGLLATIGSISDTIQSLDPGSGDSGAVLDSLKAGLAAPLAGMGTAFSASLFGLSGSLVLGFLDLQAGRAQTRFYTELENWLSSVTDLSSDLVVADAGRGDSSDEIRALSERLRSLQEHGGSNPRVATAMANLADGISGLVKNMRSEQQIMRDWVEAQSEEQKAMRRTLDRLADQLKNRELN